ncbi:RNA ligase family protein [Fibrella aestuarina]|nr:RNA ligase family protein [Fibrella aestuarina]
MNLVDLIAEYGKDRLNSLTKFPSILTLHGIGDRGRLTDQLTTTFDPDEPLLVREKVDGTNVRILITSPTAYTVDYIVGSRESLLHRAGETMYDPSVGIVDWLQELRILPLLAQLKPVTHDVALRVVYGELYGGNVGASAKQYGKQHADFRIFDVTDYRPDQLKELLAYTPAELSQWRERETYEGIVYGQPFLTHQQVRDLLGPTVFKGIPILKTNRACHWIGTDAQPMSHADVLERLRATLPLSRCIIGGDALGKAEGVILTDATRSKIVKVRFEDYERTLRSSTHR